jgi:hypothetical protein
MQQSDVIKFQKTLALAASASNKFEAEAAELAARRVMHACNLDPTRIPNGSFYSHHNFADSPLLAKLREEYRQKHPAKLRKTAKRVNTKPRKYEPKPEPVNTKTEASPFDFEPKPVDKPVNTKDPRNRDRHSPGYMREYMRRRRAAQK